MNTIISVTLAGCLAAAVLFGVVGVIEPELALTAQIFLSVLILLVLGIITLSHLLARFLPGKVPDESNK
jgi:hypothetical protein